eukprot:3200566-Rhodomonas_salina.1
MKVRCAERAGECAQGGRAGGHPPPPFLCVGHAAIYGGHAAIYGGSAVIFGDGTAIYGGHAAIYGGDAVCYGGSAQGGGAGCVWSERVERVSLSVMESANGNGSMPCRDGDGA